MPFLYFAVLALLAIFIMVRISAELATQARRPIKDAPDRDEEESVREMAEVYGDGAAAPPSKLLKTHLDSLELYVPPLTTTLLNSAYEQSAERVAR